jgi:small-conductance mechanosensitive channel
MEVLFQNQYFVAALIVVCTFVGAQVVAVLLQQIKLLTKKSKTKLDDYIINAIAKIVRLGVNTAGVMYAIYYLWPEAMLGSYRLVDLFIIVGFIWAGIAVQKMERAVSQWYTDEIGSKTGKASQTIFSFIDSLSAMGIWMIVVMLILQQFGIEIGPLLAGLGIAGVALALGLQDTLAGIFSALYIAMDQPLRIGDYVRLSDGTEGFVEDISWRSVRLETFAENAVIIPNSQIASMTITNYYLPNPRTGASVPFGVSYDADLDKVEKAALDEATKVMKKLGVKDYEPVFRVSNFGDSAVDCKVVLRAGEYADRGKLISDVMIAIKKRFDKESIEIPFPQMDVHTKK